MNLHEYQGKQLFADYGLPVSKGFAVDTPEEAEEACKKIGGDMWVVKAQVHAGGRGKAGGFKLIKDPAEAKTFAEQWLGKNLVTFQTDEKGQPVAKILVETCTDIADELYLGAVVDRTTRRVVFMASTEGGVEIETVAEETPEKILKAEIDPLVGAQPYQARELAFELGLKGDQIKQFTKIFLGLSQLFHDKDLALLEINPLVVTEEGNASTPNWVWIATLYTVTLTCRPCVTLRKKISVKPMRRSGNLTMSRLMATSAAWLTAQVWPWAPWTSST